MWDLTVPGNGDHDFYVLPASRHAVTSFGRGVPSPRPVASSVIRYEAVKRTPGIAGTLSRIKQTCRDLPIPSCEKRMGMYYDMGASGCEGMVA